MFWMGRVIGKNDYGKLVRILYNWIMTKRIIPAVVWQEREIFVAKTLSFEVASQGKSEKEALENLQEAVELLLEDEGLKSPLNYIPQNPQLTQVQVYA